MKVYISPSTQENNVGVNGYGTEEAKMNAIADLVIPGLHRHSFITARNNPGMELTQVVADSNAWGADIHVAIHSNAGGGQGTEAWAYANGGNGERLAQCIYKYVAPLSPGTDRGIKTNPAFMELGKTKAPAVIIEVGFHDNAADADSIKNNPKAYAEAIVHGICDYAGVTYVAEVVAVPAPPVDAEKEALKAKVVALEAYKVGAEKDFGTLRNQLIVAGNRAVAAENTMAAYREWAAATRKVLSL